MLACCPAAGCKLTELPPGPYLAGLSILDISKNPFQPSPLPATVAGAPRLQQLGISLPVDEAELATAWPQMQVSCGGSWVQAGGTASVAAHQTLVWQHTKR